MLEMGLGQTSILGTTHPQNYRFFDRCLLVKKDGGGLDDGGSELRKLIGHYKILHLLNSFDKYTVLSHHLCQFDLETKIWMSYSRV